MEIPATHTKSPGLNMVKVWYNTGGEALLDPEFDCHAIGYGTQKTHYKGRNAMLSGFFGELEERYSEWQVHVDRMIDGGNDVTVMGRYQVKVKNGPAATLPFVHVWTAGKDALTSVTACTDLRPAA